jgi:hypothetical protein
MNRIILSTGRNNLEIDYTCFTHYFENHISDLYLKVHIFYLHWANVVYLVCLPIITTPTQCTKENNSELTRLLV